MFVTKVPSRVALVQLRLLCADVSPSVASVQTPRYPVCRRAMFSTSTCLSAAMPQKKLTNNNNNNNNNNTVASTTAVAQRESGTEWREFQENAVEIGELESLLAKRQQHLQREKAAKGKQQIIPEIPIKRLKTDEAKKQARAQEPDWLAKEREAEEYLLNLNPIPAQEPEPTKSTKPSSTKNDRKSWSKSAIEDLLLERSLSMKSSVSGNLVRCTVFDVEGNVTVVSGEFKKSELLSKV